jgi:cytochrome c-type biogenesis protein CcmH/NrfG
MAIGMLATLSMRAGDLAAARDYAEQAQALRTRVGHRHSMAVGWELLAEIAEREGKPDEAAAAYREAIALLESLGNRPYSDELRRRLAALPAEPAR